MENNLNHLYRKLSHKHRSVVQEYLDTLGLYIGQPRFLFELEAHSGLTQNELASLLQLSKETVSVTLRRLESAGFVIRKQSDKDKRTKNLYLSNKGKLIIIELRENFDRINNSMYSKLSEKQIEQVSELFSLMISGLEKEQ